MGIDIYVRWKNQSPEAKLAQSEAWLTTDAGDRGYLREAYHGEPYATEFLVAEAFETGEASISAAVLRDRLPRTLALAEEHERVLYQSSTTDIEDVQQSYRDFVALCEEKERETGEPVRIVASY